MRTSLLPEEPLLLYSTENETAALGSMLFGPKAADQVFGIVSEDDFHYPPHKEMFRAMLQLSFESRPIDPITLESELLRRGKLEEAGGRAYILRVAETVPSPANARFYAENIREYSTLRNLEGAGTDIVQSVRDTNLTIEDKIANAEAAVFEIGAKRMGKDFMTMASLANDVMLDIDHIVETGEETLGMTSGFPDLDKLTTGMYGGDLTIVAARPSMGKTSFALAIAQNVARKNPTQAVAIFSLEMSSKQLARRLVSMLAEVNSNDMKRPNLSQDQLRKITDACEKLYGMNLFIDESSDISGFEMLGKLRRLKKEHGLSMVVVDYLQLMRGNKKTENRVQEVSDIARALKAMAKELDVPIMALSQLSRAVENREGKRPQLSDLRESGSIEAEADLVMMIYRDQYYKDRESPEEANREAGRVEEADIIIAKHRNGPTDTVKLGFKPTYALFASLARGRSNS